MRYFMFFYHYVSSVGEAGHGIVSVSGLDFPACSDVIKIAARRQELGISEIVLTGWQEMNEEDFASFTKQ